VAVVNATETLLRFGVFELNLETEELHKSGTIVKLAPQPFKLLVLLAIHSGQVVTRDEIQKQLWGEETFVDFDQGVNKCIKQIRAALNDDADKPLYVETLPRHGYRFLAPVVSKTVPAPQPRLKESSSGIGSGVLAQVHARIAASSTVLPVDSSQPKPTKEVAAPAVETAPISGSAAHGDRPRIRWVAITLIALFAGGLCYWYGHHSHQEKATALTEKDVIVLADFDNKTGDKIFDGTLRQALAIQLEQSPFLNVLSDRKLSATLTEMSRPVNDRLTKDVTREICLRTNSRAYLAGSIAQIGDHYLIGLRTLNCETDQTVASIEVEAKSRNDVIKALGDLGNQTRKKLGESLASLEKFDKPLAEATTSSLEALQAFTMARKVQREKGDAASIPYAKRSLELDANFAQGYATLGILYRNLGEHALAVENLKKAYALRDRVTQRERFFIEAAYHSFVTGDLEQANQTYTEWTQTYPKDVSPYVNLAVNYMRVGEYSNSLEQVQEAHALAPDNGNVYANLMASYLGLNRLDGAKAAFDEARARKVDNQHLRANRYLVAFLQGDAAGMQEQLNAAIGRLGFEDMLLQVQSDTEAYYGRFATAREFSQRAMDSATQAKALETAAEYKAAEALREAEVGNATLAKRDVKEALALKPVQEVESIAALALARAGDVSSAARLADTLSRSSPQDTLLQRYVLPTIRAAIALDRKQYDKAVQVLQIAKPYERSGFSFSSLYPAYVRGLAYLEARQATEASSEFRKLLEQRGVVQNFVLGALAHLQLARAEIIDGDKAAAQKEYAEFLALWKDADPDLPILRQARLEYLGLQ
jgi:DNA-binding winged helix-turn-helix (wHTH) protein/tetratricopeptide (TPR) repeat protein